MMDLSLHISKLLFLHNRLVIPKLGVFEVEIQDAYNHPVSDDFTPKYKKIKFSKDFLATDNFLSKSISGVDADKIISEFVDYVKHSLETNKSFEFVNIGNLKLHDSGALVFEQDLDFNYEKSYFGLAEFISNPIEREKEIVTANLQTEKNVSKPKLLWLWLSIAAVAILVVIFIFFQDYIIPNKPQIIVKDEQPIETVIEQNANNDANTEIVKIDSTNEPVISDSSIIEETAKVEEQIKVEEQPQEVVVEKVKPISTKKYYVIAGCFQSDTKAQEYLIEIQQKGYNEASIEGKTNGGLIRVCYAGFDRYSKATAFMNEVSSKESKSLWIQKITH